MLKSVLLKRFRPCALFLPFFLTLSFTAAVPTANAQTTDVFGRTASGATSAANSQETATQNHVKQPIALPEPVRLAVAASIELQGRLNKQLQDSLASQRNGTNMLAAWTLMVLSFGYGVLHALGPGHGKLVVSAYLVSHRARVGHAVALSAWSACVQAISAVCLVGGAAWLTRAGLGGVLTHASSLDLVSYIALLAVGLVTVWSIATNRDCCDEKRIALVPKRRPGMLASTGEDGEAQEPRYLGATLSARRRARTWAPVERSAGSIWIARQILMTGLAVGARPCVGAIFVLIAALANGIFLTGVLSAFAMAAGVMLTVLAVGLTSLSVNRLASNQNFARRQAFAQIRARLALAGALFITIFAAWQVFALLAGWRAASLT